MKKTFKEWLREKHLKECAQCQREGKARLMDADVYALAMYNQYQQEVLEK